MALPLYREAIEHLPVHDPVKPEGNVGLWFERFYNEYKPDFLATKANDSSFADWLSQFNHLSGDQKLLDRAVERQSNLANVLGGRSSVFKGNWHFATGMGYPHPLENGLLWHPVWGVPYLPGSSVKGMVRAWVEAWQFDDNENDQSILKQKRLLDWFGSVDKAPQKEADAHMGKIVFFDAIPVQSVKLVSDIMTPHMGEWYANGHSISDLNKSSDRIPADWHSPTPIQFLCAKEPVFFFSLAPVDGVVTTDIDLDEVMQALTDALDWLGAGAKTATGYGQFLLNEKATLDHHKDMQKMRDEAIKQKEQAESLINLSGVTKAYMEYVHEHDWKEDKNAFWKAGDLEHWFEQIGLEPDERAIESLRGLFQSHFPGLLENPDKVKGKKNRPVFKDRQRDLAKRFLKLDKQLKESE